MNEKTIDQIEEEVLSYEVCDEAVEAAGTRTEIAVAWTFICTGIQCNHNVCGTIIAAIGSDVRRNRFSTSGYPPFGKTINERPQSFLAFTLDDRLLSFGVDS